MARWTQTWLTGLTDGGERSTSTWPGRRYGLPPEGSGAVASTGARFAALVVDFVVGALIGRLIGSTLSLGLSPLDQNLLDSGAVAVQLLVLQTLTGQSIGMRLLRIRVARTAQVGALPGFLAVAVRTALLLLVVPAVLLDGDRRGLHDKAAGTVVLNR